MSLLKGASHCEIDAKVLKEVGLEMHLHTHSEGFRNGLVGTLFAAEGMGLAEPLVSPVATYSIGVFSQRFFLCVSLHPKLTSLFSLSPFLPIIEMLT